MEGNILSENPDWTFLERLALLIIFSLRELDVRHLGLGLNGLHYAVWQFFDDFIELRLLKLLQNVFEFDLAPQAALATEFRAKVPAGDRD